MKFEDLQFKSRGLMGRQARHDFPNGYGVSVVIGPYSYGGSDGQYELAVMCADGICYTSGITEDVLGYLSIQDVNRLLLEIEALPEYVRPTPEEIEDNDYLDEEESDWDTEVGE